MSVGINSNTYDDLQLKISLAENVIIEEYMRHSGNLFISFSGGKDSQILMHIAKRLFPHLPVVFSNTTNEMQEIMEFVKSIPDVIHVYPEMNFKEVIKNIGFPLVSKEVSQKVNELKNINGKKTRFLRYYGNNKGNSKLPNMWRFLAEQPFEVSNKCCTILKKKPLEKWAKEHGNATPLIALMSDESMLRQQLALYGKEGGKKVYPFLRTGWTEADIWEYSKRFGIRFAECYYDRIVNGKLLKARPKSGCEYCNFGIHLEKNDRFERSRALAPKKYEVMMKQTNNGVSFREAIELVKNPKTEVLGIYGGTVRDVQIKEDFNKEIYVFDVATKPKVCTCCGSKKLKKDVGIYLSFVDSPNPRTNRKRVVEAHYDYYVCSSCGMTHTNYLHMFDMRFNVTKRLIDYVYDNICKKSELEIANETGLAFEDVWEIVHHYFTKDILRAYENKRKSIWFDDDNNLIKAS